MNVVGVDASELFLDRARSAGTAVDYRQGDLRDLPVEGPFDAAVSWFTCLATSTMTGTAECSLSIDGSCGQAVDC